MSTLIGHVTDTNGNPVFRSLRVYRRDNGALLGETQSSAVTGQWTLSFDYIGEVQVVMLDDGVGTLENDQIIRVLAE